MTFATDLATLPYDAREQEAKGFLPPIARATGHLLFVLTDSAIDAAGGTRVLQDEEALGELTHAQAHWRQITGTEVISAAAATHITNYGRAIDAAIAEFADWTADQRRDNLRDLANRGAGLMAALDRELVGLRNSDPGFAI